MSDPVPVPTSAVAAVGEAVAKIADIVKQRDQELNTPLVQAAKAKAEEIARDNQIADHVAGCNLEEIRKDVGE